MMNPLDEYFMCKQAGWQESLSGASPGMASRAWSAAKGAAGTNLGQAAILGVGGATLGAAVTQMPAAVQKIWGAITKRRDFKQMLEINPGLTEVQAEDPQFFNHAYNSLRRLNPTYGSDPLVAGSYMRKMMGNREGAGITLAQTLQTPQLPPHPTLNMGFGMSDTKEGPRASGSLNIGQK